MAERYEEILRLARTGDVVVEFRGVDPDEPPIVVTVKHDAGHFWIDDGACPRPGRSRPVLQIVRGEEHTETKP